MVIGKGCLDVVIMFPKENIARLQFVENSFRGHIEDLGGS